MINAGNTKQVDMKSTGLRHGGNPREQFNESSATANPGAPFRRPGSSVAVRTVQGIACISYSTN
jgi:hypothetical protein